MDYEKYVNVPTLRLAAPAITDARIGAAKCATPRYALYFAPPEESAWWRAGSRWLGRCAVSGLSLAQPVVIGVPTDRFAEITAAPRRYGFHATLKAPFRLAPRITRERLIGDVERYAACAVAFALPSLRVELMDDFLALCASEPARELSHVAKDCVTRFDGLRAPLSDEEIDRRTKEPLDATARRLLAQWGYPHVLERHRFHLSLTGRLPKDDPALVRDLHTAAQAMTHRLAAEPLMFDAICVFEEPAPGAPFRLVHRARFGL